MQTFRSVDELWAQLDDSYPIPERFVLRKDDGSGDPQEESSSTRLFDYSLAIVETTMQQGKRLTNCLREVATTEASFREAFFAAETEREASSEEVVPNFCGGTDDDDEGSPVVPSSSIISKHLDRALAFLAATSQPILKDAIRSSKDPRAYAIRIERSDADEDSVPASSSGLSSHGRSLLASLELVNFFEYRIAVVMLCVFHVLRNADATTLRSGIVSQRAAKCISLASSTLVDYWRARANHLKAGACGPCCTLHHPALAQTVIEALLAGPAPSPDLQLKSCNFIPWTSQSAFRVYFGMIAACPHLNPVTRQMFLFKIFAEDHGNRTMRNIRAQHSYCTTTKAVHPSSANWLHTCQLGILSVSQGATAVPLMGRVDRVGELAEERRKRSVEKQQQSNAADTDDDESSCAPRRTAPPSLFDRLTDAEEKACLLFYPSATFDTESVAIDRRQFNERREALLKLFLAKRVPEDSRQWMGCDLMPLPVTAVNDTGTAVSDPSTPTHTRVALLMIRALLLPQRLNDMSTLSVMSMRTFTVAAFDLLGFEGVFWNSANDASCAVLERHYFDVCRTVERGKCRSNIWNVVWFPIVEHYRAVSRAVLMQRLRKSRTVGLAGRRTNFDVLRLIMTFLHRSVAPKGFFDTFRFPDAVKDKLVFERKTVNA